MIVRGERILNNILLFFEYYSFFCVFFRRKKRETTVKRRVESTAWTAICGISILMGFDWRIKIVPPVPLFLPMFILLIWIIYELSVSEALLTGIFSWLTLSYLEGTIIIALKNVYNIGDSTLSAIIMLSISGCIWLFYLLSRKKYNTQAFSLPVKIWVLLDSIMVILMSMLSFFGYVIVENLADSGMNIVGQNLLLLSSISIIILLFAFVYFYSTSCNYRVQKEITEIQIKQQKEYFARLLEKEEATKKFRHDVINDLLEIQNFCDNHECAQMGKYLEKVTGVITAISNRNFDVGNDIVNTIINHYLNVPGSGFDAEVNGYMEKMVSIDERDLCVICANIIKNAVEAVKKTENGKIWVNVNSGRDYLSIRVKNTYSGEIEFDKRGFPVTLKKDKENHGIGVHNISDVVKRNGGFYNMKAEDGIFETEVYLKYRCA